MSWDFYVRHYDDEAREKLNSKATYETTDGELYIGKSPPAGATFKGIWYPRAATLGGCAAHNAMVTVYPHEKDWDGIAALTGDSSWAASNMRQYFERLEDNLYLNESSPDAPGHGFDGWLGTQKEELGLIFDDKQQLAMVEATSQTLTGTEVNVTDDASLLSLYTADINTDRTGRDTETGMYQIPIAVKNNVRSSPRDLLVQTAANLTGPGKLTIRTNALVTKIRFENGTNGVPRAVGVDFLDGSYLYSVSSLNTNATGTPGSVNATKEVIISGGTFNTPQILKLSGIGPAAELKALGIPVVKNLPGVGANLQDHYEISTVINTNLSYSMLQDCTWLSTGTADPCYVEYVSGTNHNGGPYASNILPAAVLFSSSVATSGRDTFVFGGPIKFTGYFQGYTNAAIADTLHWSWLTLKAHEGNHAGTVTLKSTDPREAPAINFHYFDNGTAGAETDDITPLVEGIEFTRKVYENIDAPYNAFTEVFPGANTTTTDEIEDFIRNEAWGHHASGTAKIGAASDPTAVLNSKFQVRGVSGLRVVDASVFPEIPGFFPVVSVYMIGEKAADVILADNA